MKKKGDRKAGHKAKKRRRTTIQLSLLPSWVSPAAGMTDGMEAVVLVLADATLRPVLAMADPTATLNGTYSTQKPTAMLTEPSTAMPEWAATAYQYVPSRPRA